MICIGQAHRQECMCHYQRSAMTIIDNIPVWGAPIDEGAMKQIRTCYSIFGRPR